jgi:hypothetical protein
MFEMEILWPPPSEKRSTGSTVFFFSLAFARRVARDNLTVFVAPRQVQISEL